eukprot:785262-Pelagomonas_calceolata.AAC.1
MFKRLGTNLNMSTSHHPQTGGQTERANRTVEDMLRAFIAPYQTDWDEHIAAAEFAYNNSVQASTGFTPLYLNHGRYPHTPLSLTLISIEPISSKRRSTQSTRKTENMLIKIGEMQNLLYEIWSFCPDKTSF